ncbi:MAG: hypothetical protein H6642_00895 [Caldilineaceae bacterium]|nr:hypothetical protein [Caldilineaceae bacterium]
MIRKSRRQSHARAAGGLLPRFAGLAQATAALLVALTSCLVGPAPAAMAEPAAQGYTVQECGAVNPDSLREEIEALSLTIFTQETAAIDIDAMVNRAWQAQGMDAVIDESVAAAVARVSQDSTYLDRFLSGWSTGRAAEFATAIADDAFSSPQFTRALEGLAADVADDLTDELAAMTARAGSTALLCLQEYVGERYSTTLYELFTQEVTAGIDQVDLDAVADLNIDALDVHGKGLTGLGIIIVTQLVRRISVRLTREVGERIAGRIASRVLGRLGSSLIPLAGWIIGGGLLAWDLYEGNKGALPQIEESLTSPEIKAAIAADLAAGVKEELLSELTLTAGTIATDMVEEWRLFCSRFPYLCSLPAENESLRAILDTTPVQEVEPLSVLVDAYMDILGRRALEDAVATGRFEDMLSGPLLAAAVIRSSASEEKALAWLARGSARADGITTLALYRYVEPDELSDGELDVLLSLEDPAGAAALVELEPDLRSALLTANPSDAVAVAVRLSPSDLRDLLDLTRADPASLPDRVQELANTTVSLADLRVTATIQAERNARATAVRLTAAAPTAAATLAAADVAVSERSFREASPILIVGGGLLLLLLIAWLFIRLRYGIKVI